MGNPTWMYKRRYGKVESKVFDSDEIPDGWVDSPAKVEAVGVIAETDGRKIKPKRTPRGNGA